MCVNLSKAINGKFKLKVHCLKEELGRAKKQENCLANFVKLLATGPCIWKRAGMRKEKAVLKSH